MSDAVHPFERRGLGRAPFRFIALRREPGVCAHCGRLIARSCTVADAGGREAVVGTDCVRRTCEGTGLLDAVERELRHARKQEAAERHEARRVACLAVLRADAGFLADRPHPDAWRTDKTMRDEVLHLFRTQAGRNKAFGIIEATLAGWGTGAGDGASTSRPGRRSGTRPGTILHPPASKRRDG